MSKPLSPTTSPKHPHEASGLRPATSKKPQNRHQFNDSNCQRAYSTSSTTRILRHQHQEISRDFWPPPNHRGQYDPKVSRPMTDAVSEVPYSGRCFTQDMTVGDIRLADSTMQIRRCSRRALADGIVARPTMFQNRLSSETVGYLLIRCPIAGLAEAKYLVQLRPPPSSSCQTRLT